MVISRLSHERGYTALFTNPGIRAHEEDNVQSIRLLFKHHDTFSLLSQIKYCSKVSISCVLYDPTLHAKAAIKVSICIPVKCIHLDAIPL